MRQPLKMTIILLTALSCATTGDARTVDRRPAAPLRIGTFLSAIDYAPYYVAKRRGCLDAMARESGRKIVFSAYSTIPAVNAAVGAGQLDIILEADSPAILQLAAHADLRAIMPLAALNQQVLLPPSSPVTQLGDLRGARIGVLFGSGYHFAIVDGLKAAGVAPDTYTLVDVRPDAGDAALASRTIDAWAIWPPILQRMVAEGKGRAISGSASTLNVYAFGTTRFIRDNPKIVARLSQCMRQSIAFIRAKPRLAIPMVVAETGIAEDLVTRSWPTMSFGFPLDRENLRVLNAQAAFFRDHGAIDRPVIFTQDFFLAQKISTGALAATSLPATTGASHDATLGSSHSKK